MRNGMFDPHQCKSRNMIKRQKFKNSSEKTPCVYQCSAIEKLLHFIAVVVALEERSGQLDPAVEGGTIWMRLCKALRE